MRIDTLKRKAHLARNRLDLRLLGHVAEFAVSAGCAAAITVMAMSGSLPVELLLLAGALIGIAVDAVEVATRYVLGRTEYVKRSEMLPAEPEALTDADVDPVAAALAASPLTLDGTPADYRDLARSVVGALVTSHAGSEAPVPAGLTAPGAVLRVRPDGKEDA